MAAKASGKSADDVAAFIAQSTHPAKALIVALRRVVLGASPAIADGIKWNAPSYRTTDYFATTHLRAAKGVGLILHFGAKKNAISTTGIAIPDPAGLLDWLAKDRAMILLNDEADLAAKASALQALLREWITHL